MSSYFRCLLNRDGCPLLHTNIKFRWQSYDIPRHDIVFGPVTYVGRWYLDDAHRLLTVESGFGTKTTQLGSLGPESLTRRLLLEKSPISAGPLAVESGARDSAWQGFNLLRGSPTHVLEHSAHSLRQITWNVRTASRA